MALWAGSGEGEVFGGFERDYGASRKKPAMWRAVVGESIGVVNGLFCTF